MSPNATHRFKEYVIYRDLNPATLLCLQWPWPPKLKMSSTANDTSSGFLLPASRTHFINIARNFPDFKRVRMNDVDLALSIPSDRTRFFTTENLSASTAVAIFSPTAAIIAHIAPTDPENPSLHWEANLETKLRDIEELLLSHRQHFRFPQVVTLAAHESSVGFLAAETVHSINEFLHDVFDIPWRNIRLHPYRLGSQQRQEGETSLVIWWKENGELPIVCMDEKIVFIDDGTVLAETIARTVITEVN